VADAHLRRPDASEYGSYYETYISKVPGNDVISVLEEQLESTGALLKGIPESRAGHRYAPEKWSIRQIVGHLGDAERIFGYRALRISRGDKTPLEGFDQNTFMIHANFDERSLADLWAELEHLRQGTLLLFKHLPEASWDRVGVANNSEITPRALAYVIAGHERHHMGVLRERYLK
jgi:hypothetical protein